MPIFMFALTKFQFYTSYIIRTNTRTRCRGEMVGVDLDSAGTLGPDPESIRTTIGLTKSNQVVGLYAGSLACIAASKAKFSPLVIETSYQGTLKRDQAVKGEIEDIGCMFSPVED
ncbi:hypothetical protein PanWU01x14_002810 [Parasponia andersonii]|uniref:Uncharacterized protein n=1 Tax=Parasponia andersonii TaxID=3476 RepID=A0A2P5E593_PARAD|nr:hypothetical protein PanWU01x14_002810 [Parasponia andersonii]